MATVTSSQRKLTHTSNTYESNGDVTIGGNLNINGTTTTIDTANLLVEDKNIVIGDVSSPTDTTADGGGITLKGATDKTLSWINSTDSWTSNQTFSAPNLTLTGLSNQSSEATALVVNGSNVVGTRELGSNAFNSTSFLTGNQTITLSGDVSGSGTTSISVTVNDDSHNHVISNVDGLQTALNGKAPLASPTFTGTVSTPDLSIGSGNKIKFANNDFIRYDDGTGVGRFHFDADGGTNNASVQAATFVGALSGNASTATTLATSRSIALSGDVTGSVSFNGSSNVSISTLTNKLRATDDRDVKPSTTGISSSGVKAIKPFFTTFNGMTGTSGGAYQDMIALDTYSDSSGGGPNAMTFSKGAAVGSPVMYIWKGAYGGTTWGTGQRVFADNYHPNADTLTTARTIALSGAVTGSASFNGGSNITIATTATADPTLTLSGDASGSATFTNLGNATLSVTVANNSHSHTIANVTSLQSTLDAKLPKSGGTMTGALAMGNFNISGVNNLVINDPGPNEGISWNGGNTKIYESPDDLTTNTAGNLQIVHGGTRRLSVNNAGIDVNGNIVVSGTVDGRDLATDGSKLDGIASSANNYSLPAASSSTRGGVKIGFTEIGKNYPVEVSSEKMFVTVPWTDNNTTYSAGSGLSLAGTSFSHSDTSSQATVNNSDGTVIQDVTLDTYGHITSLGSANLDNRYLKLAGGTMTNNINMANAAVYNAGYLANNSASTRSKLRLWGTDSNYAIGMESAVTFGGLADYAMTFQFNSDDDRGFWWGDSAHSKAQGAMALTTSGLLTVANKIKVGFGESDTSTPATYDLYTSGGARIGDDLIVDGKIGVGTTGPSFEFHINTATSTPRAVIQSTAANSYPTLRIKNDARQYDLQVSGANDSFRLWDGTAATERFCVSSAGDFGIGTASPIGKLDVRKAQTTTAFTSPFLKLFPTGTTNTTGLTSITLGTSVANNYGISLNAKRAGTNAEPTFVLKTHNGSSSGTDVLSINNGGDAAFTAGSVGIGTPTPLAKLQIREDQTSTAWLNPHISLRPFSTINTTGLTNITLSTTTATGAYGFSLNAHRTSHSDGDAFTIKSHVGTNAGNDRFTIRTNGRIGINDASPSTTLDVNGITTSKSFRTNTSNTDYNVITRNSTSTTLWVQAAQSGSIQGIASFRYGSSTVNAGTEVCAIRRNSSYFINTRLGVGTNNPHASSELDVDGIIRADSVVLQANGNNYQLSINGSGELVTSQVSW